MPAKNRRRIDRDEQIARTGAAARDFAAFVARVLGALALTVLVAGGAVSLYAWLRSSPRFEVQTITFAGTRLADAQELQKRAGFVTGVNIFSVDLAQAAKLVEQDPWVLQARVARELPATIRVVVEERRPVALVDAEDLYAVDEEAVLFKRISAADRIDLPLITGLTSEGFLGEKRRDEDLRTALEIVKGWETSDVGRRLPLAELNIGAEGGATSYTAFCSEDPVVEVRLGVIEPGTDALADALARLERVHEELRGRGATADRIDLGNRQRPDWVAARLDQPARRESGGE